MSEMQSNIQLLAEGAAQGRAVLDAEGSAEGRGSTRRGGEIQCKFSEELLQRPVFLFEGVFF